jgi:beta-glucosidase-like glycosyl hydrolase
MTRLNAGRWDLFDAASRYEDPYVDPARADEISGSAASRPLALEAARQAIVLLQNRGGGSLSSVGFV